jgi:copper resistance protein B
MKSNSAYITALVAANLLFTPLFSSAEGLGLQANPDWNSPIHDDDTFGQLLFDRFEVQNVSNHTQLIWDAQAWYGKDLDRLWIETEGSYNNQHQGEIENLDLQYSRRISPFWDAQMGLGTQTTFGKGDKHERYYAIIGLQGLAPYWFEIDSNIRFSDNGDTWLDFEAEYDWRLTQKWVLQARAETSFSFSKAEQFEQAQGFSGVTTGLRLRYHITREFAPYIGASYSHYTGKTADLIAAEGDDITTTSLVAGMQFWF